MKSVGQVKPNRYLKTHASETMHTRPPEKTSDQYPGRRNKGRPAGHRQLRENQKIVAMPKALSLDNRKVGARQAVCGGRYLTVAGALMDFRVRSTDDTARNPVEVCGHIDRTDSSAQADYVPERKNPFPNLSGNLGHGRYPEMLSEMSIVSGGWSLLRIRHR